jgi:hypothetical protein
MDMRLSMPDVADSEPGFYPPLVLSRFGCGSEDTAHLASQRCRIEHSICKPSIGNPILKLKKPMNNVAVEILVLPL